MDDREAGAKMDLASALQVLRRAIPGFAVLVASSALVAERDAYREAVQAGLAAAGGAWRYGSAGGGIVGGAIRAALPPHLLATIDSARDDRGGGQPETTADPSPAGVDAPVGPTWCPQCGPRVAVDEDGCCQTCGATAMGEGADAALAAEARAERAEAALGRVREVVADLERRAESCRGLGAMERTVAKASAYEHAVELLTTALESE